MKKILHIISSVNWRGGEQQVNYMFNHPSAKYAKYLFCPDGAELVKRNSAREEKIFTYKKRLGFDFSAGWNLKKVCEKNKIDLLHIHDSHAINTFLLAGIFGMKTPAIIHRHVNFPVNNKWKYALKRIQCILCVSETVKETMQQIIPEKNMIVVHPGIDVNKFSQKTNTTILNQELGLSSEMKLIGTTSALEKEKNIGEFISIAKKVIGKRKDVIFVIIGQGSEMENIIRSVSNNQPQIKLLGSRNDIPDILPSLDVFLFTSKSEGFPLVLLEAMAAKVPIVTTNAGGIKNMITHHQNGLFYEQGNIGEASEKLEQLLIDDKLVTAITKNASDYVRQFDVTLMNEKIESVYSSLNI